MPDRTNSCVRVVEPAAEIDAALTAVDVVGVAGRPAGTRDTGGSVPRLDQRRQRPDACRWPRRAASPSCCAKTITSSRFQLPPAVVLVGQIAVTEPPPTDAIESLPAKNAICCPSGDQNGCRAVWCYDRLRRLRRARGPQMFAAGRTAATNASRRPSGDSCSCRWIRSPERISAQRQRGSSRGV
jgi:hypothetical protein